MRKAILCLVALAPMALTATGEQLFNGKDLDGWEFVGRNPGTNGFTVADGAIQTGGAKGMLLYSRKKLGNVNLHVVYKMSNPKGNSGVFIRIPVKPDSETVAINKGIEVQIDDRDDDYHCTGVLYSMTKAKARASKPAGEWNTMDITMQGLRTTVKVNGVLVTDYDGVSEVPAKVKSYEPDRGPRPEMGYIGLQNHDPSAVILFKEISISK
ncbi:MAG TPA: DUF1080 domain-containing protein [Bryobacteraceae bacterium]|nr:DUF1080 domain-containing protein [Bryobacteraceae bacterium]